MCNDLTTEQLKHATRANIEAYRYTIRKTERRDPMQAWAPDPNLISLCLLLDCYTDVSIREQRKDKT